MYIFGQFRQDATNFTKHYFSKLLIILASKKKHLNYNLKLLQNEKIYLNESLKLESNPPENLNEISQEDLDSLYQSLGLNQDSFVKDSSQTDLLLSKENLYDKVRLFFSFFFCKFLYFIFYFRKNCIYLAQMN